ncbi:MAG: division/cell wall cluster transcriptional repressor MraZ [Planctomycetaceae bacterium]|nr:division/cell wall cluster transcriptional repressor MraZ [Planctomycetaceae bacterium]
MANLFLQGEHRRTLDERYRISIPTELSEPLTQSGPDCILIKEQPGALSLWNAAAWQQRLEQGVQLIRSKLEAGRLEGRMDDVQHLGRLLSTRHRPVQLAGRGRLVIPEGFREFLGVAPGGEVMIVGAALCVEFWRPAAWLQYLEQRMPEFHRLFTGLSA